MVLAYHVIFCTYGFWLPNDPRGSWSTFVAAWELFKFGAATKTESRRSVAAKKHNRQSREEAKTALKYPVVVFDGTQACAVGLGFGTSIEKGGVQVWACSILPEHVHMVIARHEKKVETLVGFLKGEATKRLVAEEVHPLKEFANEDGDVPTCWARKCWKVFLDSDADIRRAIQYVEQNPLKEGKPRQNWVFVTPYEGLDA
jgi:REP element-mobilizing transposase RayT